MSSELTQALDELVQEKTFSLAGVEAIKKLRDHAATLENDLQSLNTRYNDKNRENTQLAETISRKEKRIIELEARDASLTVRENKVTILEKNEAVSQAVATAWYDAFHTVFKNTTFRENTTRQMPVTYQGSGGYTNWEPKTESVTREQE